MTTGRLTPRLQYLGAGMLVLAACTWPLGAQAHDDQASAIASHDHISATRNNHQTSEFVRLVREATRRFQDPIAAIGEKYFPQFGCVSGSHEGAMGLHFVNDELVGNPAVQIAHP